jgi:hypothetical protein
MKTILDNIKSKFSDWLASADSKRLVATVLTAVVVTVGTFNNWLTEDQAQNIAGLVIAAILGDSYRPMNPSKLEG